MSQEKTSTVHSASNAASVAIDLGMSDATIGSILRGLLGKLARAEVVTVVPDKGAQPVAEAIRSAAQSGELSRNSAALIVDGRKQLGASVSRRLRIGNFEVQVRSRADIDDSTDQPEDDLDHAILAAEKRGQVAAASIVDCDDMLSTAEVAERIGISRQAVTKRRNNGQILSLKAGPKALKYPDWQILPTGEVVSGIEDVLARFDGDTWTAFRTLKEIAPDGSGRPLHALLRDGDVASVLAYIDGILGGAVT